MALFIVVFEFITDFSQSISFSLSLKTVNQAASEYASWLLGQPQSKLSGALNHKLDIDHSLTKLLYEDKRGIILPFSSFHLIFYPLHCRFEKAKISLGTKF